MGEDLNEYEMGEGVDMTKIFEQMFAGGNNPFGGGFSFGDGAGGFPGSSFNYGGRRGGRTAHFNFG